MYERILVDPAPTAPLHFRSFWTTRNPVRRLDRVLSLEAFLKTRDIRTITSAGTFRDTEFR